MATTKQKVGLEMLSEAREGEFGAAHALLLKILGNVCSSPDEPKFRTLRTSNAKINQLLQTKGVRALLVGSGFAESPPDLLVLPPEADLFVVQAGLQALQALQEDREQKAAQDKAALLERRNEQHRQANENRDTMKKQIMDDATMRKEPGWKAQAAGCKESSRSITTATDIGASGNAGG